MSFFRNQFMDFMPFESTSTDYLWKTEIPIDSEKTELFGFAYIPVSQVSEIDQAMLSADGDGVLCVKLGTKEESHMHPLHLVAKLMGPVLFADRICLMSMTIVSECCKDIPDLAQYAFDTFSIMQRHSRLHLILVAPGSGVSQHFLIVFDNLDTIEQFISAKMSDDPYIVPKSNTRFLQGRRKPPTQRHNNASEESCSDIAFSSSETCSSSENNPSFCSDFTSESTSVTSISSSMTSYEETPIQSVIQPVTLAVIEEVIIHSGIEKSSSLAIPTSAPTYISLLEPTSHFSSASTPCIALSSSVKDEYAPSTPNPNEESSLTPLSEPPRPSNSPTDTISSDEQKIARENASDQSSDAYNLSLRYRYAYDSLPHLLSTIAQKIGPSQMLEGVEIEITEQKSDILSSVKIKSRHGNMARIFYFHHKDDGWQCIGEQDRTRMADSLSESFVADGFLSELPPDLQYAVSRDLVFVNDAEYSAAQYQNGYCEYLSAKVIYKGIAGIQLGFFNDTGDIFAIRIDVFDKMVTPTAFCTGDVLATIRPSPMPTVIEDSPMQNSEEYVPNYNHNNFIFVDDSEQFIDLAQMRSLSVDPIVNVNVGVDEGIIQGEEYNLDCDDEPMEEPDRSGGQ